MAHRKSSSVPAPACRCCHLGRDCAARCPAAGLLRLCTLQASPRRWWQGLPWLSAVPDRSAALSSPCRSLRRSAGTQVSCCMELASAEGGLPLCPLQVPQAHCRQAAGHAEQHPDISMRQHIKTGDVTCRASAWQLGRTPPHTTDTTQGSPAGPSGGPGGGQAAGPCRSAARCCIMQVLPSLTH